MQAAEREWLALRRRARAHAGRRHRQPRVSNRCSNRSVDAGRAACPRLPHGVRGPFYSPLRLPDVLARGRAPLRPAVVLRHRARELAVTKAVGLGPDDLLVLSVRVGRAAHAAVGLRALRVLLAQPGARASARRVRAADGRRGRQRRVGAARAGSECARWDSRCASPGWAASLTAFDLIARARPDYLSARPRDQCRRDRRPDLMDIVQLLLRFAARIDCRLIAPEVGGVRR